MTLAAAFARAERRPCGLGTTITVTVRPLDHLGREPILTGGIPAFGEEGVGFGVALTFVRDDLWILVKPPSGTYIAPTPWRGDSGDVIWSPARQVADPQSVLTGRASPWAFEAFGASPGADHGVNIGGDLVVLGAAAAANRTPRERSFRTAAADIQMDTTSGGWGSLLGGTRRDPSDGGGIACAPSPSFTGSISAQETLTLNSSGNWADAAGSTSAGGSMSLNLNPHLSEGLRGLTHLI